MNFKKIIFEVFVILFLSIVIGLLFNKARKNPLEIIGTYDLKEVKNGKVYEEKTVSADELFYYISKEEAVIFDARDREFYKEGHIPFAISLPVREFETVFDTVKGVLNSTKTILIYCIDINCNDSSDLAKKLFSMGYNNIYVYKGGIVEWKDELNYRVEM